MQKFFAKNTNLAPYYLVLQDSEIKTDENLTPTGWKWTDVVVNGSNESGNFQGLQVVPARQGFFVRAADGGNLNETTVTFTTDMMVPARTNDATSTETDPSRQYLTIRAQRAGNVSEARVIVSPEASNTFRPEEDIETFLVSDISSAIPVVYTLTGQLATSINHLNHFRSLPLGIISNSTDPAILTFYGVESIDSDLQLYDAYLKTFTPLVNGSSVRVPGSTQNRFYLVSAKALETFNDNDIEIVKEGGIVYVSSTNGQPLTRVTAYDLGGRILHSSEPATTNYRFSLPEGINLVKAETEAGQRVKKIE